MEKEEFDKWSSIQQHRIEQKCLTLKAGAHYGPCNWNELWPHGSLCHLCHLRPIFVAYHCFFYLLICFSPCVFPLNPYSTRRCLEWCSIPLFIRGVLSISMDLVVPIVGVTCVLVPKLKCVLWKIWRQGHAVNGSFLSSGGWYACSCGHIYIKQRNDENMGLFSFLSCIRTIQDSFPV